MSNQHLYDAIITLDRSARDADNGGWICGLLFEDRFNGPKCVNGLITWHLGANKYGFRQPCYITDEGMSVGQRVAATIAGRALLLTVPEEARSFRLEEVETMSTGAVENLLIDINDAEEWSEEEKIQKPVLDGQTAAAWFRRARDLLAEQLPDPILNANSDARITL